MSKNPPSSVLRVLIALLAVLCLLIVVHVAVVNTPIKTLLNLQNIVTGQPRVPNKSPKVQGFTKPEFGHMTSAFQKLFDQGLEVGAQLAVYHKGELVVDLWGGVARVNNKDYQFGRDEEPMTFKESLLLYLKPRELVNAKLQEWFAAFRYVKSFFVPPPAAPPTCDGADNQVCQKTSTSTGSVVGYIQWFFGGASLDDFGASLKRGYLPLTGDSLIPLFSCSKVAESAVISDLASAKKFSLDDKISKHWPNFGSKGKEDIKIEDLMRHQAGLVYPDSMLTIKKLSNPDLLYAQLAEEQGVNWKFDVSNADKQMYHPITRGIYASGLVYNVMGVELGSYFRNEIALKHGLDMYLGIGPEDFEREKIVQTETPVLPQFFKYILQYLLGGLVPFSSRSKILMMGNTFDTLLDFEASIVLGFLRKTFQGKWYLNYSALFGILNAVEDLDSISSINKPVLLSLENLPSANGLSNARSMSKLGDLLRTGAVGGEAGKITDERHMDHGIGYEIAFTDGGYGHDRFYVDGLFGWKGWAGMAGGVLQWNEELELAFAYNTVLPYGRVGKPRGIYLMKELVNGLNKKP
ncbi:hypothetical protein TrVE_jg5169 [Triparma verrucosa]|uniref:Beta-lactamase-related domain-containing protein n=1 Tax=Triparma verrucosa TaxID=1606542 RepID=A0A9W7EPT0_9STRA|nr:hypothetical protein TrVE_jg5169 [Triparma verrucosa]